MTYHIVLFKLKDELGTEQRAEIIAKFKRDIEALPKTIDFIRSIRVEANVNPEETWHICLLSTFDSLDDVRRYAVHPDHVAVAAFIKPFVAGRACTDF